MKSFDKNKLKKQLVSGGIYIALAAAVVTVTLNGVNNIIGGSEDYEIPDVNIDLPNSNNSLLDSSNSVFDSNNGIISGNNENSLSENDIFKELEKIVSGSEDNVNSEILEAPDKNNASEENEPNGSEGTHTDSMNTQKIPQEDGSGLIADNDLSVSGEPDGIEYPTEPDPSSYGFYVKPAQGYIDKEFSSDKLIYSSTMGDYRTHNGVDITGDPGSPVKAINSGKITDIYYDDFYGYTIKVDHGDNMVAYYMNLSEDLPAGIKVGSSVQAGQTIAGIGNSASIESAEVSHLHLSISKDGQYIDPEELLRS